MANNLFDPELMGADKADTGEDEDLADIPASARGDVSQIFGIPSSPGVGSDSRRAKAVTPKKSMVSGIMSDLMNTAQIPPAMSPEVAGSLTPEQRGFINDPNAGSTARLVGRLSTIASVFAPMLLPIALMAQGASEGTQANKMSLIQNAYKQLPKEFPPAKEPVESEAQKTMRGAQASYYQNRADLVRDMILHPEKYKQTAVTGGAGEKETRLNAKDFAQERDRAVKAAEDARKEKMGGVTLPFSQLEHEALLADTEESLSPNYPGVKLTDKYKTSRDLKEFIDEQLQKYSDAAAKGAIMKADTITMAGKKTKLTPSMKANMIGYIDALKAMKGLPKIEGEAGTPQPSEIPAAKKGYFSNLFGAIRGK